jgi:hypothetical protein
VALPIASTLGERGDAPVRQRTLLNGEAARKRLGIPMLVLLSSTVAKRCFRYQLLVKSV